MTTEGYLLDTTIASWARDHGSAYHTVARQELANLAPSPIFISSVTPGEVEYGFRLRPDIDAVWVGEVRRAMAGYKLLSVDRHTAEPYAAIRAALFRKYAPKDHRDRVKQVRIESLRELTTAKDLGIQENDLWIVSVAVEYNLRFITADRAAGMRHVVECANYLDRTDFWP